MKATKSLVLVLAAIPAAAFLVDSLFSKGNGMMPTSTGPNAHARGGNSCGGCHNPFVGGPFNNPIDLKVTPTARVMTKGQSITMTVTATGGAPKVRVGTQLQDWGGLAAEVSTGTLSAGSGTTVNQNTGRHLTHTNAFTAQRKWSFGYKAPTTGGPVEFWVVANTVDGNGRNSGDYWAWHGSSDQNTFSTPVRMYVNDKSATVVGTGCADGNGNVGVLGSPEAATVGNSKWKLEAVGLPPGQKALMVFGFQQNFKPVSVDNMGAFGCFLNTDVSPVQLLFKTTGTASRINKQMANGTLTLPTGIPNSSTLKGLFFRVQLLVEDPDAKNPFKVVFTNGLAITVQ